jgi:hypothetical protein
VVAVATRSLVKTRPLPRRSDRLWAASAAAALLLGLGLRLAFGAGGIGDVSAMVMACLVAIGVWLAAVLAASFRAAFFCVLGLMVLLDLGALPVRGPIYDDREAFFRTDQVLRTSVAAPTAGDAWLLVLAEPVFSGSQPRFGLSGSVGGASAAWTCEYRHGMQWLTLPVATAGLEPGRPSDVTLQLTGSPARDGDYLLVYSSATRGGFLVSLVGASEVPEDATRCTPA